MESVGVLFQAAFILGLVLLVLFVVLCINVGKIKRYAHRLYLYEKVRMLEEGRIDPNTNDFTNWRFNDSDVAKKWDSLKTTTK
jgi:hypothetical protein